MHASLTDPRRAALLYRARLFFVLFFTAATLYATGCQTGTNPLTGNRRVLGYSWEQEKQLGAQSDEQIVQQFGLYQGKGVQQYVRRIGERVLQESALRGPEADEQFRNTEFTFRVLDSPVVNAFALPGGYVYVTRGLLTHLNNEAQLAVVLGHEIVHVAGRHASKRAGKQQLYQVGLIGAALGGQAAGLPGGDILQLGSQATQLLFLRYGRDDERESDQYGVEYAAKAGYDVAEGAEFFRSLERIQEKSGQALPSFLSTHPDPGEREARIREMAGEWRQRLGSSMTELDQDQYYRILEGMVLGEDPRQGFTRNGVFYHPELRFRFPVPDGFRVQNTPQQVAMVAEGAQLGFTFADASSPRAAAQQLAREVSQAQGARVLDSGSARSGDGIPAEYVLVQAQTQQGQEVRLLAYFLEYGGQVYTFQGVSTASGFSRYQDVFLNTMRGFSRLTDRSILNMEPARLAVRPAPRTAPFRTFVDEGALPPGMDAQELAIINQVELDEQIERGRELKLPRK